MIVFARCVFLFGPWLTLFFFSNPCALATNKGQPNILFIISDDQSWEAMGLYDSAVQTPNLDKLARESTYFSRAYNMGGWSGAVCVASRNMLNTGRTIWRAYSLDRRMHAGESTQLWADHLQDAGYTTYFSGKWHVEADPTESFDYVAHKRPGMPKTVDSAYFRPPREGRDEWSPYDKSLGGFWAGGKHWSEVLGDDGVQFLRQASEDGSPFFMYLAFNAPHDPRQSPTEYVDRYPREAIEIPQDFLPEYPYKQEMGCYRSELNGQTYYLRDEKLAPWPRTPEAIQLHRQEYYAIITHMDDQVGRILEALEQTGKAEDTVVIFTSDHGLSVGHHGLLGKQNMYEHSLRVPLMIWCRSIPAGKVIDTPVYMQDIMPTTLELAGVKVPECVEFRSLLPLIRGERKKQYEAVYAAMWRGKQRAIIVDNWKLIHYPQGNIFRLFNLKMDPNEMVDLIELRSVSHRIESMKIQLRNLQAKLGDPLLFSK